MALENLEKQLMCQKAQVNKHKRYFLTLFHGNDLMVPAMLLPAFIMGWIGARIRHPGRFLKYIGKFLLPVILTHIKPN